MQTIYEDITLFLYYGMYEDEGRFTVATNFGELWARECMGHCMPGEVVGRVIAVVLAAMQ